MIYPKEKAAQKNRLFFISSTGNPMFIAPLLLLILLAILFPRFVKFILTLLAFGVLFAVASCIDHANADQSRPELDLQANAKSFEACMKMNSVSYANDLHQLKMLGGDSASSLMMSCSSFIDPYVHFCMADGYSEKICYANIRGIATAIDQDFVH